MFIDHLLHGLTELFYDSLRFCLVERGPDLAGFVRGLLRASLVLHHEVQELLHSLFAEFGDWAQRTKVDKLVARSGTLKAMPSSRRKKT